MASYRVLKLFRCGICKFSCSDINELQDHSYDVHICTKCNKSFFSKLYHRCHGLPLVGGGPTSDAPGDPAINVPSIFQKVSSSFRDTICIYKTVFIQDFVLVSSAVDSITNELYSLVNTYVKHHTGIRLKFQCEMEFEDAKTHQILYRTYPTPAFRISHPNFIKSTILDCSNYVSALCDLLSNEVSGLILLRVISLNIVILRYTPTQAKSWLPLGFLKRKRGILNSRVDNNCFHVSVLLCLHANEYKLASGQLFRDTKKAVRQKSKRHLESKKVGEHLIKKYPMKYADLNYGRDLTLLSLFEREHGINISVFQYSKRLNTIIPLRLSEQSYNRSANLLMILRCHLAVEERVKYNSKRHFCAIINTATFFNAKKMKKTGFCTRCSSFYHDDSHPINCMSHVKQEIKFPTTPVYRFTSLHKTMLPQSTFYTNFLFANTSNTKNKISLSVMGFGLVGVDNNYKELFSVFYTGEHAIEKFYDHLLLNGSFYLDQLLSSQIPLSCSAADRLFLKGLKSCYMCGRDFNKQLGIIPCAHHNHYDPQAELQFPCTICNLKAFCLRKIVTFTYDLGLSGNILLENISNTAIKSVTITPKTGEDSFLAICLKNQFLFYDAKNHFGDSLQNVMSHSASELSLLKAAEPTNYPILAKCLPFPHSFLKTHHDLKKGFPQQNDFYDINYQSSEQSAAYGRAKTAFNQLGCSSLEDYALYYLKSITYGLADCFGLYSKMMFKHFQLHPNYDLSISSFSSSALHYSSKASYDQLTDLKIYQTLKDNLIGGLSISAEKLTNCKSRRLGDDVSENETVEALYFDYTRQYLYLLGLDTPHSEYKYYTQEDVEKFHLTEIEQDKSTNYFMCVDLHYPDNIKKVSRGFPFCPTKMPVMNKDLQSLYAFSQTVSSNDQIIGLNRVALDQNDKYNVWISSQNLLLFLKLGMVLVKIHNIISFKVKRQFTPFVEICARAFSASTNPIHRRLIKNTANFAVGNFMSRSINERVAICLDRKRAVKLLSSPDFISAKSISESIMTVSLMRRKSLEVKNVMIAFFILQESKRLLYELYYLHFLPIFKDRLSCVLIETDALIIRVDKESPEGLYAELKKLSNVLEYGKVPKFLIDLHDSSKSNQPGMVKIESMSIRSVVSLRSKQFSILEIDLESCNNHGNIDCKICVSKNREIVKGVKKAQYTHQRFLDILNQLDLGISEYSSVSRKGTDITIQKKSRLFASLSGSDRVFLTKYSTAPIGYVDV